MSSIPPLSPIFVQARLKSESTTVRRASHAETGPCLHTTGRCCAGGFKLHVDSLPFPELVIGQVPLKFQVAGATRRVDKAYHRGNGMHTSFCCWIHIRYTLLERGVHMWYMTYKNRG